MKITGNDLLDKNACAAGVAFYLHNRLQDVDWDAVKKIELTVGAHREYAEWLCSKFGLTMSVGTADGREASYENGNQTHYRDSNGYEEWQEYDGGILISATVKGCEPETLDDSVLKQLGIK